MSDVPKYSLTQGGIISKLMLVALPIIGSQVIMMTYNLTDMFWLGRLSSAAVAASGTVGMYIWLSTAFVMFGRMGAEIGVSQNIGKGDAKNALVFARASVLLGLLLGVAYALVMVLFRHPLIGFFGIREKEVCRAAEEYLAIMSIGLPFTFLSSAITGIFTGSGNSRLPFYINIVGLGLNMALDPLLIFGFNIGITGAAYATSTAQIISAILSLLALFYSKQRPFKRFSPFIKPKAAVLRQIAVWAAPVAVESFLFTFLTMVISRFVAGFGSSAMAAQRVGSQAESLSWLIGGGFSSALTAYIGQNYGAGKWSRIHKGFRLSSGAMFLWGIVVAFILYFGARPIFYLFLPNDPAAIEIGAVYMRILALCQFIASVEGVAAGAFRGMGRTLPPSIVSISCNAARVVLAFALMNTSLGLNGIWWALTIGAIARGLLIVIWYLLSSRKMPRHDLKPQTENGGPRLSQEAQTGP